MPAIRLGEFLGEVAGVLVVVELSLLPPEKAFRARLHRAYQLAITHLGVSANLNAGDGQSISFFDDERDLGPGGHLRGVGACPGQIVALGLIHGIDARNDARNLRRIDGPPDQQVDLIADGTRRHSGGTADIEFGQHRTLGQREHDHRAAVRELAAHPDVFELPGRVEILDGALQRAVVERRAGHNGDVAAERRFGHTCVATKSHAVRTRARARHGRRILCRSRRRDRQQDAGNPYCS